MDKALWFCRARSCVGPWFLEVSALLSGQNEGRFDVSEGFCLSNPFQQPDGHAVREGVGHVLHSAFADGVAVRLLSAPTGGCAYMSATLLDQMGWLTFNEKVGEFFRPTRGAGLPDTR